ncbi:Glutathione s-transferase c-terminal domain-containing protein, partial [Globisporangium splendens]
MNGVLPELTWGTWDEQEWDSEAPSTAHSLIDNSKDASATTAAASGGGSSDRSRRKLGKKGLSAPTQSQLWFEEVLTRVDHSSFAQGWRGYQCNPLRCLHGGDTLPNTTSVIPWEDLPDGIHPRDGKLPPLRARNKRHQVENLAVFLQRILRPGDVVVEFCAGSGYVALPLACLFPQCTFVLLDKKEPSLAIAGERIAAAGLTNVEVFCGFINEYDKPFDVGIALHACGEATDMVMQKCLDEQAAYVLAPCCVGKIKLSALEYPRSRALRDQLSRTEYQVLAKAADFGHQNTEMSHSEINMRRRRCKSILESDRNMRAQEAQYQTFMFVMHPHDVTPKNDILVGIPAATNDSDTAEERRFAISCTQPLSETETVRVIFGL